FEMWGFCIPRLRCLNPLSAVNFCIETYLRWLQPVSTILFKTIRSSMEINVQAPLLQSFFFP
ncbi:MAG: hypothetical protein ACKPJD_31795, partial [Planctomycetaceae bacterium]